MANILGTQTVDGVYVINVDADPTTSGGTDAPLGSVALTNNGVGTFTKTGAGLTAWSANTSAPFLGVARYVYLVQDSADAIKLGGAANNVYTTWQAAYNAANVLQVLLGGSNTVVIQVGNTTAATVGNLVLTANWNTNVQVNGISSNASRVGTITLTTFTINAILSNITVGIITTSGSVTLTLKNSVCGNITMTSATGDVGSLLIQNTYNFTIGIVTMNSVLGNSGSMILSNCSNGILNSISIINTSIITAYSVGGLGAQNCQDIIFNAYTNTLAFDGGTSVGGLDISKTCSDIHFNGPVNIKAFTGIAPSDNFVNFLNLYNTVFRNVLRVNHDGTSPTGGYISDLLGEITIENCSFNNTVGGDSYISYNPTTTQSIALGFRMYNCNITYSYLTIYVENTTFEFFDVQSFKSTITGGLIIDGAASLVPFMGSINMIVKDVIAESLFLNFIGNPGLLLDVQVISATVQQLQIGVDQVKFYLEDISVFNGSFTFTDASGPASPSYIIRSSLNMIAPSCILDIKSSQVGLATTANQDLTIWGTTLDMTSGGAQAITLTGTAYTSTLVRSVLATNSITMNNSFDQTF